MWNPFKWNPIKWIKKRIAERILKKILKEVFMWEWFNGHKRQIGGALAFLVLALQYLSPEIGDPAWIEMAIKWVTWIGTTFFAVGWGHAAKKRRANN